jgi:hypothetical protein
LHNWHIGGNAHPLYWISRPAGRRVPPSPRILPDCPSFGNARSRERPHMPPRKPGNITRFRVEIGRISNRRRPPASKTAAPPKARSGAAIARSTG